MEIKSKKLLKLLGKGRIDWIAQNKKDHPLAAKFYGWIIVGE